MCPVIFVDALLRPSDLGGIEGKRGCCGSGQSDKTLRAGKSPSFMTISTPFAPPTHAPACSASRAGFFVTPRATATRLAASCAPGAGGCNGNAEGPSSGSGTLPSPTHSASLTRLGPGIEVEGSSKNGGNRSKLMFYISIRF